MRKRMGRMMAKGALFLTIAVAGFGKAVEVLWNWLMPAIFGLPAITFWQAVGLLALSWILFGSWRGFRGHGRSGQWNDRMMDRWEKMTPEEREQFRTGMRRRC